jgi:uncharacterized protein YjcR
LKQGTDGMPVADICRKAGISQATYFNWKKKYDGLRPTEMRRLKQLKDENAKGRIGSDTTTKKAHLGQSGKRPRFRCLSITAQPARRHDKAGKL